jgi:hypothetical protein
MTVIHRGRLCASVGPEAWLLVTEEHPYTCYGPAYYLVPMVFIPWRFLNPTIEAAIMVRRAETTSSLL